MRYVITRDANGDKLYLVKKGTLRLGKTPFIFKSKRGAENEIKRQAAKSPSLDKYLKVEVYED